MGWRGNWFRRREEQRESPWREGRESKVAGRETAWEGHLLEDEVARDEERKEEVGRKVVLMIEVDLESLLLLDRRRSGWEKGGELVDSERRVWTEETACEEE